MDRVKLSRKQFEELIVLALYIDSLSNLDDDYDTLGEEAKKKIVADLTAYSQGSIRNRWSEPNPVIQYDRFKFFCESYIEKYDRLSDLRPEESKINYEKFIHWIKAICKDTGWKNPLIKGEKRDKDKPTEDFVVERIHLKSMLKNNEANADVEMEEDETVGAVVEVVNDFYKSIAAREYRSAWNLLSNSGKKSKGWHGEYGQIKNQFNPFYTGLFWFGGIKEMYQLDEDLFECQVLYSLEYTIWASELDTLFRLTLADLEKFNETIELFKDKLLKNGSKDQGDIRMKDLFKRAGIVPIWSRYVPMKSGDNNHLSPGKQQLFSMDICLVKLHNEQILIDHVRRIKDWGDDKFNQNRYW